MADALWNDVYCCSGLVRCTSINLDAYISWTMLHDAVRGAVKPLGCCNKLSLISAVVRTANTNAVTLVIAPSLEHRAYVEVKMAIMVIGKFPWDNACYEADKVINDTEGLSITPRDEARLVINFTCINTILSVVKSLFTIVINFNKECRLIFFYTRVDLWS